MSISQVGCLVGTVDIPTVNLAFAQGPISAGSSTRLDRSLAQPCCSSNRSVELSSRRLKCKRRVGRSVHRPIKWLVANPTQSPRANFPYLELARSSHRLLCITCVTPRAVSSACLLTRPPAVRSARPLVCCDRALDMESSMPTRSTKLSSSPSPSSATASSDRRHPRQHS